MQAFKRVLFDDESGLILSAELILIVTIGVLGLVTGLTCVQQALVSELQDFSMAMQSLNQSFATPSYRGCMKWWGRTSWVSGSAYIDLADGCVGNGCVGVGAVATHAGQSAGYTEVITREGCVNSTGSECPPAVHQAAPLPPTTSVPCETCPPASNAPLSPVPLTPHAVH